jgi:hypothetical protein
MPVLGIIEPNMSTLPTPNTAQSDIDAMIVSPNLGEYEGLLDVDERLAADLIAATQAVVDALPT